MRWTAKCNRMIQYAEIYPPLQTRFVFLPAEPQGWRSISTSLLPRAEFLLIAIPLGTILKCKLQRAPATIRAVRILASVQLETVRPHDFFSSISIRLQKSEACDNHVLNFMWQPSGAEPIRRTQCPAWLGTYHPMISTNVNISRTFLTAGIRLDRQPAQNHMLDGVRRMTPRAWKLLLFLVGMFEIAVRDPDMHINMMLHVHCMNRQLNFGT